jgi:hypothetical protein
VRDPSRFSAARTRDYSALTKLDAGTGDAVGGYRGKNSISSRSVDRRCSTLFTSDNTGGFSDEDSASGSSAD